MSDAENLLKEVLDVQRRVLGTKHPDTLISMATLASWYVLQGTNLDQAESLLKEAWEGCRTALDAKHETTDAVLALLSALYSSKREYSKLGPYLREAQQIALARWGSDHGLTVGANVALGRYLFVQKQYSEAEVCFRDLLRHFQKTKPEEWELFNTESWLGACLVSQTKFEQAEPILLSAYGGMRSREKTIPLQEGRAGDLRMAIDRIIQLYDASDKKDKADEWRMK